MYNQGCPTTCASGAGLHKFRQFLPWAAAEKGLNRGERFYTGTCMRQSRRENRRSTNASRSRLPTSPCRSADHQAGLEFRSPRSTGISPSTTSSCRSSTSFCATTPRKYFDIQGSQHQLDAVARRPDRRNVDDFGCCRHRRY